MTVAGNYQDLKKRLGEIGVFEAQPVYYSWVFMGVALGYAISLFLFTQALAPVLLIANTLLFAFVSVQLGFVMHDAGHGAIFRQQWKNDAVGLVAGNLLNGLAFGWWAPHHNRHHAHPNHDELDPDLPVLRFGLALSEEEAQQTQGLKRLVVRHQVFFVPVYFALETLTLKFLGFKFLLLERSKRRWLELALVTMHHVAYVAFLAAFFDPWPAIGIAALHHMVAGTHLSAVLMTNHVGRPFASKATPDPFVDQVEPSRNVRTHPLFECFWGSLNHQIEHHLFPSMSRNQIRRSLPIVKAFCAERGIAYEEVPFFQCYRQILGQLRRVGRTVSGTPVPKSSRSQATH